MSLLTQDEVAERLGVSVRTLMRMRQDGRIECLRMGRGAKARIRFTEEQVSRFIQTAERMAREQEDRQRRHAENDSDDLRTTLEARLAVRDIMARDRLRQAKAAGDPREIAEAQAEKLEISRRRSELRRRFG